MATAADRKRWDKLHADYEAAKAARDELEIEMDVRYGRGNQTWWPRGAQTKFEKLKDRQEKIRKQLIDLIVHISPRGETWLHGVPSHWLVEKLTWEDTIRPTNEPLSVVVPGAYGYPDGYVKERHMPSKRNRHSQSGNNFKDFIEDTAILVAGDGDVIDLSDSTPVQVAVVVDVTGYGPHVGAIYAMQRGHVDEALESAFEILEEWEIDHYPEADHEHRTETFDGRTWTLKPEDFADAIEYTAAAKYIELAEEEGDVDEDVDEEDLDEEEYE